VWKLNFSTVQNPSAEFAFTHDDQWINVLEVRSSLSRYLNELWLKRPLRSTHLLMRRHCGFVCSKSITSLLNPVCGWHCVIFIQVRLTVYRLCFLCRKGGTKEQPGCRTSRYIDGTDQRSTSSRHTTNHFDPFRGSGISRRQHPIRSGLYCVSSRSAKAAGG